MALRKVGKIYHVLYRDLEGRVRTLTTGETNKGKALVKEQIWMVQLAAERIRKKRGFAIIVASAVSSYSDGVATMQASARRKRLKLADWLAPYGKQYGEPAVFGKRYFSLAY